jgi:undecaprenyl-diphosphatase
VQPTHILSGMISRLRLFLEWLGSHGPVVIIALLIIVIGAWGFIELADEVREGGTQEFDEWMVRAMRRADNPAKPIGPRWLAEVGRDITGLGGIAILCMSTAAVAGYLLLVRKLHAMWLLLIATGGGLVISTLLKWLFARERPDVVPHLSDVITASFPSGHAMMSAVVYLTLGALLTRLVPGRLLKLYVLALALGATFLVGISRIYMGVHYPTDVLAGWAAGLVWALICWVIARMLQQRGAVETDVEGEDSRGSGT